MIPVPPLPPTGAASSHRCKMMCGRADDRCDSEETPGLVSRPPSRIPSLPPQTLDLKIDFFSQARKSLSERSPFDTDRESLARVSTLPFKLSLFLSRQSHNRRRKHKKSRSDRNVWVETEDYFRPVTLADVDFLGAKSLAFDPASDSCFSIPLPPGAVEGNAGFSEVVPVEESKNLVRTMKIDSILSAEALQLLGLKYSAPSLPTSSRKKLGNSTSSESSMADLHWLLGCKHRVLLGSESFSKKRKFLDEDMELKRLLLLPPPEERDSDLCHVCCFGKSCELGNRFLSCCSCNVIVHQKCYGVKDFPLGGWLCSWCMSRDLLENGGGSVCLSCRPCLLCPKEGGALKPISGDSGGCKTGGGVKFASGNMKFAHLFCSQWMPKLYVENIETMEPIMNFGDVKDSWGKLACYLCKMKYGICIQCSHGTCRATFHPLCAREARQRMEVWGRVGCDNVELRAFCLKHSGGKDVGNIQQSEYMSKATVGKSSVSNSLPMTASMNKVKKLTIVIGHKNRNKGLEGERTTYINGDKMNNKEIHSEQGTVAVSSNNRSHCGVAQQLLKANSVGVAEMDKICGINPFHSFNPVLTLKKLIDQGKANVSDVASEMNLSSVSLESMLLNDSSSFPLERQLKVIKWLLKSAHISTTVQQLKFRRDVSESCKPKCAFRDGPLAVNVAVPGIPIAASVMSLLPRQIEEAEKMSSRDHMVDLSYGEIFAQHKGHGILADEISENPLVFKKDTMGDDTSSHSLLSDQDRPFKGPVIIIKQPQPMVERVYSPGSRNGRPDVFGPNAPVESSEDHPDHAVNSVALGLPGTIKGELASRSFVRAFSDNRLMKVPNYTSFKQEIKILPYDGQRGKGMPLCFGLAICPESVSCDNSAEINHSSDKQLVKARELRFLELSPEDEVEVEVLHLQTRLFNNIVATKHHCENLISRIVTDLPYQLDALKKQRWDAVLIDQFLLETREEKEKRRKERGHDKAQAVLAAPTPSGISSFCNDVHDKIITAYHEGPLKVDTISRRSEPNSQLIPCRKATEVPNSKLNVSKLDHFEISCHSSDLSKENAESCDICNRSETKLNPILVCSCCKWVLESTFKRRQLNLVRLGIVSEEKDFGCTCGGKFGVCLKRNYRHYRSSFHPTHAKNACLYLNARTMGGNFQQKACCKKHILEHTKGNGDKKPCNIRQIRMELEKVRLICSRILKREKLKRELVLCSHDILASRREIVAVSVLVHSSFFQPDVSLVAATSSLTVQADDMKSSNGVQRLDDFTDNSMVSGKIHGTLPLHVDIDRKTDCTCPSHQPYKSKPTYSAAICKNQLPYRAIAFAF